MAATDPDSATPAEIRLEDVQMSFGKRSVLTRFSEHFPAGKISVVLGGSEYGGAVRRVPYSVRNILYVRVNGADSIAAAVPGANVPAPAILAQAAYAG